jgi:NADH dehydrogenase
MTEQKKVVIIGGGFGGIQTALDLSQKTKSSELEIVLISNKDYFEYYPGLHSYLSVAGALPFVKTSLSDIFKSGRVSVMCDTVTSCDFNTKNIILSSGETISADYIVVAVGSESTFFNIEGLPTMSFPFQNTQDAERLRTHVETLFSKHCTAKDIADCVVGLHFVVVGAGPNGVDLAGELADFTKYLCKKYSLNESLVTIDLIEGAGAVLPMMGKDVQGIVRARLRNLGVNILCNRQLLKQGSWTVALADMTLGAKTLIWTAGTTTGELVTKIPNIVLQKKNRITVNDHLEADGHPDCFVIGDAGDTKFSGLAQTAIDNGKYLSNLISRRINNKPYKPYTPKPVAYNIGVGQSWSITAIGSIIISGKLSSWLRRLIDLKYFLSILPLVPVLKLGWRIVRKAD